MRRATKFTCENAQRLIPSEDDLSKSLAPRPRPKLNATFSYGPFERLASFNAVGSSLLTFTGLDRRGNPFKCMLDCGSTHDWVDTSFAAQQGPLITLSKAIDIEFANGEQGTTTKGTTIMGRIGGHRMAL